MKDYEDHKDKCSYWLEQCEFCLIKFLHCDLDYHNQSCEKKPQICPGCNTKMYKIYYQ